MSAESWLEAFEHFYRLPVDKQRRVILDVDIRLNNQGLFSCHYLREYYDAFQKVMVWMK